VNVLNNENLYIGPGQHHYPASHVAKLVEGGQKPQLTPTTQAVFNSLAQFVYDQDRQDDNQCPLLPPHEVIKPPNTISQIDVYILKTELCTRELGLVVCVGERGVKCGRTVRTTKGTGGRTKQTGRGV
jgi:hypothetical protein